MTKKNGDENIAVLLNLRQFRVTHPEQAGTEARCASDLEADIMYALAGDKNLCSDKWLASLVDAMDEVESLRADDFCRASDVPSGLIDQLYGRNLAARQALRVETRYFALA